MKIIQATINGIPVLLVQYDDNTHSHGVFKDGPKYYATYFQMGALRTGALPEPPLGHTWRFVNITTDVTEEQAAELVEKEDAGYLDYVLFKGHLQNYVETALESFVSFLKANGIEDGSTWGLIVGEKV